MKISRTFNFADFAKNAKFNVLTVFADLFNFLCLTKKFFR